MHSSVTGILHHEWWKFGLKFVADDSWGRKELEYNRILISSAWNDSVSWWKAIAMNSIQWFHVAVVSRERESSSRHLNYKWQNDCPYAAISSVFACLIIHCLLIHQFFAEKLWTYDYKLKKLQKLASVFCLFLRQPGMNNLFRLRWRLEARTSQRFAGTCWFNLVLT